MRFNVSRISHLARSTSPTKHPTKLAVLVIENLIGGQKAGNMLVKWIPFSAVFDYAPENYNIYGL